jgi:peroxiredoxin family protein
MTTPVTTARDEPAVATPATKRTRLAIIATKGTLDWAYPPLMMALQAAKKNWDVAVFFTFYGLNIIHRRRGKRLRVPVPTLVGAIPGMTALATRMMQRRFRSRKVPSIEELLQRVIDAGVKLYPCGFSIDVFGYAPEDFVAGCQPRLGSPDFLEFAKDADITLLV